MRNFKRPARSLRATGRLKQPVRRNKLCVWFTRNRFHFLQSGPAGKIDIVLATGNLCNREMHDFLRSLAQEFHVVKGELDQLNIPGPDNKARGKVGWEPRLTIL